MKLFNNIEELWNYCGFCPVCKSSRNIELDVGPDYYFNSSIFEKKENILTISANYENTITDQANCKIPCQINYTINCSDNSFHITLIPANALPPLMAVQSFYFFIQAFCPNNCHNVYSHDIEFLTNYFLNKISYSPSIEEEIFNIKDYYVSFRHEEGKIVIVHDHRYVKLPMINLEFSNPDEFLERVKTYIIFG